MKKIIISMALIGLFLFPVKSFAVDCTPFSYNSLQVSSLLSLVTKINDLFVNGYQTSTVSNCDDFQPGTDPSLIQLHGSLVSPAWEVNIRITCSGSDCITDPDRIGGSWTHWDNNQKRLLALDGSYIGLDGIFHFTQFYVSTLANFVINGKRMNDSFGPESDINSSQLPLVNDRCGGILGAHPDFPSITYKKCWADGKTDGITYVSWVAFSGPNTSQAVANSLQTARNEGIEVYDSREHKLKEIKESLASTHEATKFNEKGAELKTTGNDYKVYVPEDSFDGVPFVFSNDFVASFSSEPNVTEDPALFGGSSGSSLLQKEGIALLSSLFDENASTNNAGNLSLQITENGAELTFKNSGVGISSVQNEGLGLTQGDIEAIRDSLIGSSYGASGSTIYIGTGSGSGGGDGGGNSNLPTTPAPAVGPEIGLKGDGEIYEPADFIGDLEKDCETLECVYTPYIDQMQALPFGQYISSLIPPDVGSTLPVLTGNLAGQPYSIDFNKAAPALDLLKPFIVIASVFMAVNIIINRQKA